MNRILEKAKMNMLLNENVLSDYACKEEKAVKLREEENPEEIRSTFFRDIDRIIHSQAYTRYIDKTQVYSFAQNDHITHRVLHVQLVSKIARTIGRCLRLNEDLIEAISLAHDVGHTPFGHKGEDFLDEICRKEQIGLFRHNAQSVRVLKDIENLNISLQTFDGILAHNGEILWNRYKTDSDKKEKQFLEELNRVFYMEGYSKKITPMTLEGCVVRISDIIAYIGRDIEDGIQLGIIRRQDIPREITKVLGDNNSVMVDTLIKDIIIHSFDKPYLVFSEEVFDALMKLKRWNYQYLYCSKEAMKKVNKIQKTMRLLFENYSEKIEQVDYIETIPIEKLKNITFSEKVFYDFLNHRTKRYLENTDCKRIIIDYIAGQTDHFFLRECKENLKMEQF